MSRNLADGPFRVVLEQIKAQHGDTLVSTLRVLYGFNFVPVLRSIDDLKDVLLRVDEPSKAQLLRDYGAGGAKVSAAVSAMALEKGVSQRGAYRFSMPAL